MDMPRRRTVPHKEGPTQAVLYLRVSTEEQASNGYGLDAQRTRCLGMAQAKGWEVVQEYADEGVSGAKNGTGRPGLTRLMSDSAAGKIDAVVILSLDRLGRKTRLVLELVDQLTSLNVALVSCKESLDTTTPQGQFVLTIFAALAQLERDLISERTKAALAERGRQEGYRGGRVPFGYWLENDESVSVVKEDASIVRKIFTLRRKGWTLRKIASHLTDRKVKTPRGGQRWYASSLKAILDNDEAYRGAARCGSPYHWPKIVGPSRSLSTR